ncbi:MAG: type IV secretion system DNA-binding domain-containing protein [Azonexaceae bacterium]|nr:type IV secretion system DNA-binding domain-containing protein [Azonexaceae bacterium]
MSNEVKRGGDPVIGATSKALGRIASAVGALQAKIDDISKPAETAGIQYYQKATKLDYFLAGFHAWANKKQLLISTLLLLGLQIAILPLLVAMFIAWLFLPPGSIDQFVTIPMAHVLDFIGQGDSILSLNLGKALGVVERSASEIAEKTAGKWWPIFTSVFLCWLVVVWPTYLLTKAFIKRMIEVGVPFIENLFIRGAKVTDVAGLNLAIQEDEERKKAKGIWSPHLIKINFGGVILPSDRELRGIYINGTTGSGKTVALTHLALAIQMAGEKAIFHDPAPEFDELFYEEGHKIFNPNDARYKHDWDFWLEFKYEDDFMAVATALLPYEAEASKWITDAARAVLAGFFMKTSNWEEFKRVLFSPLEEKIDLLIDTPGQGILSLARGHKETDYALSAIKKLYVKIFSKLKDPLPGMEKFSFRQWVANDEDRRWIYLVNPSDQQDTLGPLFTLVFEIIGRELLTLKKNKELPRDKQRRVWIILEESPCLPPIPILPKLTSTGRKYGACWVILTQDLSQLEDKKSYDKEVAKALRQTCNTWLIFQSPDGESAEQIAKQIGTFEEVQKQGSTSGSFEDSDESGYGQREGIVERQAILPSQIQSLPELSCFLMLFGTLPTAQIELEFLPMEKRIEGYVPRDDIIIKRDSEGRIIRPGEDLSSETVVVETEVREIRAETVTERVAPASLPAPATSEAIAQSIGTVDLDMVLNNLLGEPLPAKPVVEEVEPPPPPMPPKEEQLDDSWMDAFKP